MRKLYFSIIFFTLICISVPASGKSSSLDTYASAAVLLDSTTNKILFAKNADTPMAPASTTKIMTGILALEKLNLNAVIKVPKSAAGKEGSSMYLVKNEKKTVRELLYGLLLISGNDAASSLAVAISGSESNFAQLMNTKAKQLGMLHTHFNNPSGLPDPNHYTTARDLAILTCYAMKNPTFSKIVSTKVKIVSGANHGSERNLINHNKLLWKYQYSTGVKPGYTVAAGGCLVASASHDGMNLIAVVLKTGFIYADTEKLFEYGFATLNSKKSISEISTGGDKSKG